MTLDISLHKSSLCGHRPSNEDVEKYRLNLSVNNKAIDPKYAPIDFFLICDGHGGKEVAAAVSDDLEKYFTNKKLTYPLSNQYIKKIYEHIQKKLINHPKKIANHCGSTALVVVRYYDITVGKKNIQIVNLGDCRAVLSRNGLALSLSKDHKPFWSDEKKRIRSVNDQYGTNNKIRFDEGDWRIGDLSVSRSFGDLDNTPHVSHLPESFCYELIPDDEFIVMACDGVWDVLENHEVVNFVKDHLNDNQTELYNIPGKFPSGETVNGRNIARKLAEYAIANDSHDNVSVLIIFLQ